MKLGHVIVCRRGLLADQANTLAKKVRALKLPLRMEGPSSTHLYEFVMTVLVSEDERECLERLIDSLVEVFCN